MDYLTERRTSATEINYTQDPKNLGASDLALDETSILDDVQCVLYPS